MQCNAIHKKGKRMEQLVYPNELKKQVLIFPFFFYFFEICICDVDSLTTILAGHYN